MDLDPALCLSIRPECMGASLIWADAFMGMTHPWTDVQSYLADHALPQRGLLDG